MKLYASRPCVFLIFCVIGNLLIGIALVPTAKASPPVPLVFTVTQPDGITTFEARIWGDEISNGLETAQGYTVIRDPGSHYWFYAILDQKTGELQITNMVAGRDPPPPAAQGARPLLLQNQKQYLARGPVGVPSVPILVVLVQYDNQLAMSTEAEWREVFFGGSGSVADYYREVSYGQLSLPPAVETCGLYNDDGITGWLTLGTTHPTSGGPSIARAALKAADDCVNYALFDRNNDAQITSDELLPIIVVAGYEASYGGVVAFTPAIWGHQALVRYKSLSDEVRIEPYAQFGEWHAAEWDPAGHRATIGLIVHEIGHLLGWPDLYDISPPGNPDSEGVGEWSPMGTGLWLGAYLGDTPAHPSAWEKWYQGWLRPLQLYGHHSNLAVPRVEDQNVDSVIQLLDNPSGVDWKFEEISGEGEYFLIENRQKVGYDARLPGCGLLIWHIDESATFSNWANADENHKLVDLEEADGRTDLDNMANRGDGGDPYPGFSNNFVFDNGSVPDSRLYNIQPSGVTITGISPGCADVKTATFTAPVGPAPHFRVTFRSEPVRIQTITSLITYTLTVENEGTADATTVTVANLLPPSTTYIASSASNSGVETTPGSGVLTWTFDAIPAGSAIDLDFQVTTSPNLANGDRLTHTISISCAEGVHIEGLELVQIVGAKVTYLPFMIK